MDDRERQRRDDQRLRRAQGIADELREQRLALRSDGSDRRVVFVDFAARRPLSGPGSTRLPDDIC